MAEQPETGRPGGARWQGLLLLGLVFVLGMICGSALLFMGFHHLGWKPRIHGGGRDHHPMQMMSRHLELDEEQIDQVHAILERSRGRVHEVMRESRDEIREVLTPQQRERFDEFGRRMMKRMEGPRRPFGPGKPPPE